MERSPGPASSRLVPGRVMQCCLPGRHEQPLPGGGLLSTAGGVPWGQGEVLLAPCSRSGQDVPHPAAEAATSSGFWIQASSARRPFACELGARLSLDRGREAGGQRPICSRPSTAPHVSGDRTWGPSTPEGPGVRAWKAGQAWPSPHHKAPTEERGTGRPWPPGPRGSRLTLASWEAGPGLPCA